MKIGTRDISQDEKCFVIAEIGQAHDGSLGMAHSFIDAVARTGVDAVKFQTHYASEESTPNEQWRIKFSYEDDSRYDYWKRMEFSEDAWMGLQAHAHERGLIFLSSPFSLKAVKLLDKLGVPAWKIASGELSNAPLVEACLHTKKPILFSTGLSSEIEIELAVKKALSQTGTSFAIFQCHSSYPSSPDKIGLNNLNHFREKYDCPVGLSDHSGKIFPSLSAITLGAELLEVHVTMSRDMFGPDVSASLTIEELAQIIEGRNFIHEMINSPTSKNDCAEELLPVRTLFSKSLVAATDLEIGNMLSRDNLAFKKPGDGMPTSDIDLVLGRRLKIEVKKDQKITLDMLDEK